MVNRLPELELLSDVDNTVPLETGTAVVIVVAVMVVGETVRVEFVTGKDVEADDCTDMDEEMPLPLVRLVPEVDSELGGVPEVVNEASVTAEEDNPSLGERVELATEEKFVVGNGGRVNEGPAEVMLVSVKRVDAGEPEVVSVDKVEVALTFEVWLVDNDS
ncbi:hypothetical protein F5Y19DRAFT_477960 [Xylariaceae sp. FL1651]|nr:hypothetical protein F5Y19DRAFT_477960 [Xylariaceae sp. FL1651]